MNEFQHTPLTHLPTDKPFPVGYRTRDRRFVLVDYISGSAQHGRYVAVEIGNPESPQYLATLTGPQQRSAAELRAQFDYNIEGVSRLVDIAALDENDWGLEAAILLETYPPGAATSWLTETSILAEHALRFGWQTAVILHRAHEQNVPLLGLHPDLIYISPFEPLAVAGVAPRAPIFYFTAEKAPANPPCFATSFLAPELIKEPTAVSPAADVFSLCALIAWWATGQHPFAGETYDANVFAILANQRRPWTGAPELKAIIEPGLFPQPAERPSLSDLMTALAPFQ